MRRADDAAHAPRTRDRDRTDGDRTGSGSLVDPNRLLAVHTAGRVDRLLAAKLPDGRDPLRIELAKRPAREPTALRVRVLRIEVLERRLLRAEELLVVDDVGVRPPGERVRGHETGDMRKLHQSDALSRRDGAHHLHEDRNAESGEDASLRLHGLDQLARIVVDTRVRAGLVVLERERTEAVLDPRDRVADLLRLLDPILPPGLHGHHREPPRLLPALESSVREVELDTTVREPDAVDTNAVHHRPNRRERTRHDATRQPLLRGDAVLLERHEPDERFGRHRLRDEATPRRPVRVVASEEVRRRLEHAREYAVVHPALAIEVANTGRITGRTEIKSVDIQTHLLTHQATIHPRDSQKAFCPS